MKLEEQDKVTMLYLKTKKNQEREISSQKQKYSSHLFENESKRIKPGKAESKDRLKMIYGMVSRNIFKPEENKSFEKSISNSFIQSTPSKKARKHHFQITPHKMQNSSNQIPNPKHVKSPSLTSTPSLQSQNKAFSSKTTYSKNLTPLPTKENANLLTNSTSSTQISKESPWTALYTMHMKKQHELKTQLLHPLAQNIHNTNYPITNHKIKTSHTVDKRTSTPADQFSNQQVLNSSFTNCLLQHNQNYNYPRFKKPENIKPTTNPANNGNVNMYVSNHRLKLIQNIKQSVNLIKKTPKNGEEDDDIVIGTNPEKTTLSPHSSKKELLNPHISKKDLQKSPSKPQHSSPPQLYTSTPQKPKTPQKYHRHTYSTHHTHKHKTQIDFHTKNTEQSFHKAPTTQREESSLPPLYFSIPASNYRTISKHTYTDQQLQHPNPTHLIHKHALAQLERGASNTDSSNRQLIRRGGVAFPPRANCLSRESGKSACKRDHVLGKPRTQQRQHYYYGGVRSSNLMQGNSKSGFQSARQIKNIQNFNHINHINKINKINNMNNMNKLEIEMLVNMNLNNSYNNSGSFSKQQHVLSK
jgi:hypothetical protein